MRMRSASFRRSNVRVPIAKVISFATSAIIACIGFFISSPFLYTMMAGTNYHYLSTGVILMMLGFIIGAPMLLGGLIGLIANKHSSSLTIDNDVARMRHIVETEVTRRK